jgi:hypothetical protein
MTTQEAIEQSISQNEIVHCVLSDLPEIELACDGTVENGEVIEFWGMDDNNNEWRIHHEING